jgi:hypothetical protein
MFLVLLFVLGLSGAEDELFFGQAKPAKKAARRR